jgi:LysM repeat protein
MHTPSAFLCGLGLLGLKRCLSLFLALFAALPLAAASRMHTVQRGESLSSVSRKYGLELADLATANKLRTTSWLRPGQRLKIPDSEPSASSKPSVQGEQRVHTVKAGESLSSVSRHYDVSLAALAQANGLKASDLLKTGQRLKIPGSDSAATSDAAVTATLSASAQKAINSATVKSGRWKYVVIHHSGTGEGSAAGMNQYHLRVRHMENGLAYHFVIGNGRGMHDGEVYVGNRWKRQLDGGHLASERQNAYSIGVCLVGNFDREMPTARQLASLRALIEILERRCNLTPSRVKTHQQINVVHTRCPGERFPTESFLRSLHGSADTR